MVAEFKEDGGDDFVKDDKKGQVPPERDPDFIGAMPGGPVAEDPEKAGKLHRFAEGFYEEAQSLYKNKGDRSEITRQVSLAYAALERAKLYGSKEAGILYPKLDILAGSIEK